MSVSSELLGRKRRADIWLNFTYDAKTDKSTCITCDLKLKGKNTTNLKRHVETTHPILYEKVSTQAKCVCVYIYIYHLDQRGQGYLIRGQVCVCFSWTLLLVNSWTLIPNPLLVYLLEQFQSMFSIQVCNGIVYILFEKKPQLSWYRFTLHVLLLLLLRYMDRMRSAALLTASVHLFFYKSERNNCTFSSPECEHVQTVRESRADMLHTFW